MCLTPGIIGSAIMKVTSRSDLRSGSVNGPQVLCKETIKSPRCGVHNVVLERITVPIDEYAPYLGLITCYLCPVSLSVVQEGETQL
jgi:hypothetical protein